jgi:hypothetical protein
MKNPRRALSGEIRHRVERYPRGDGSAWAIRSRADLQYVAGHALQALTDGEAVSSAPAP